MYFTDSENDIISTLTLMKRRATEDCRFNEPAAIQKAATWIAQDRRFDGRDPVVVARDAFDALSHGRRFNLNKIPERGTP
jgi:hypothetical protein